jgi:LPS-assembly protein
MPTARRIHRKISGPSGPHSAVQAGRARPAALVLPAALALLLLAAAPGAALAQDASAPGAQDCPASCSAPAGVAADVGDLPRLSTLRCPAPAPLRTAPRGTAALPSVRARPPEAPSTRTPAGNAPGAPDIQVTSEQASVDVAGDATLKGDVRVVQGDRTIRADDVAYDSKTGSFHVRGAIDYRDPVMHARGGSGAYSQDGGADFEGAEFELPERPARGSARHMSLDTGGRVTLQDVSFSTCPSTQPDWRIRARSIVLDTRERTGTGRDAQVEFKGVPILYLPYMSFPLGSQRMSGFLFPSVGYTTRSGAQFSVPYYWNIAPNLDLTAQPTLFGKRGIDAALEFRYLTPAQRGVLNVDFLPGDRLANRDRSHLQLLHRSDLPAGWRFTIDAQDVSDPEYFEDFAQGPEGTSTAFLDRVAQLSYRDEYWNLRGQFQQFQTIDRSLALADRPYAEVPRLNASGNWLFGPNGAFSYGFDSEVVNFQRGTGVTGWRLDTSPTVGLNLAGAGYFLRPAAGLRFTQYELSDTPAGQSDSPRRTLPFAQLDTGLVFEKFSGARDQRRIELEPRLLYQYVPYRNQSQLPVFDTAVPDLNFVQLFSGSRYVGADRVSDANQVSAGITTRLFDTNSGARYLSATLGQTIYFQSPRVTLPDEAAQARSRSDVVAQLALTAYRNWNLDLGMQWDPQSSQQQRSEVRVQYHSSNVTNGERVINFGYRYQRDRLEQLDVSGAWPIGQRWNAFARLVYDQQEHQALERFAGVEYKACCWRLRAVARRFVSNRTGERDTGIYVQLELNGLASVGSSADTFLEQAIRGYSTSAVTP